MRMVQLDPAFSPKTFAFVTVADVTFQGSLVIRRSPAGAGGLVYPFTWRRSRRAALKRVIEVRRVGVEVWALFYDPSMTLWYYLEPTGKAASGYVLNFPP